MPALHVIDAARIAHETCRRYWPESVTPQATARWGDLPQDFRNMVVDEMQRVIDGQPQIADQDGDAGRLFAAIGESLRPFLSE